MWSLLGSALALVGQLIPLPLSQVPLHHHPHHSHGRYDGPIANGGVWSVAFLQAEQAVKNMTTPEKVNLTSAIIGPCQANSGGVPRLGIPGMCFVDGPAGPRYTDFVTQFPSAFTAAASFDRDLIEERARRIGQEFRGKGVNVALGPVTGGPLGRSPFAGRNWEAFSPDPYLSSTLSFLTVKGMQASGLITCAKHYILYEQEPVCTGPLDDAGGRTDCQDVSSDVDDKTFKELYLPTFAETVRAGTGAIMCSYNKINGTASCQSDEAMNRVLKTELGFQGFVLSDFGATHSTSPSALAGMDMELPNIQFYGEHLLHEVKKGQVPIARLDDMARRILTPWYASFQHSDYPPVNWHKYTLVDKAEVNGKVYYNQHVDNRGENPLFARKVAAESTVLLKNDHGVLPIRNIRRIGVFGTDADYPPTLSGCGADLFCLVASKRRYWNGTVTIGGGSGATYADYISSPLEAISLRARSERIRVDHVLHDDSPHFPSIRKIAAQSELCLVFASLFLVEGWDREHLKLDKEGEELIKTVEGGCAGQVVVVLHTGGQVLVEDWIDLPKVAGVVWAGYPGQESGNALVDVLWGDVNPSGKLPFTMGKAVSDWPTGNILRDLRTKEVYPRAVFSEGLAIDYKWFDKWNIIPRYEFGYGLSYTTFELSNVKVEETFELATDTVQPTNETYQGEAGLYDILWRVSVNVHNTGKIAGAEVPQLYISYPLSEIEQPPKHLKGYAKPYLLPGQTKTVTFNLRKKDLSVWDVYRQTWRVPHGVFTLRVGTSSRQLPLHADLNVTETR